MYWKLFRVPEKFFLNIVIPLLRFFSQNSVEPVTFRYDFFQFSGWIKHTRPETTRGGGQEPYLKNRCSGSRAGVRELRWIKSRARSGSFSLAAEFWQEAGLELLRVGVSRHDRLERRTSDSRPLTKPPKTNTTVYPVDRLERGSGRSEQEGVSFKLEIASSAAMMGRKLGAKLNARREECKTERENSRR